jgi:hypothetical protein
MLRLTRQERWVLTVLLFLFLAGLGVRAWLRVRGPVGEPGAGMTNAMPK